MDSTLIAHAGLQPSASSSDYQLSTASPTLQRRKAVRGTSKRPFRDYRTFPPTRTATTLHLATPRDIHRLSLSSVNSFQSAWSDSSFVSNTSYTSYESTDTITMPVTPPPATINLPVLQTKVKQTDLVTSHLHLTGSVHIRPETSPSPSSSLPLPQHNEAPSPRSVPALRIQVPVYLPRQPAPCVLARQNTVSSISNYSQSSAESEAYDAEQVRQIRRNMVERLMSERKSIRKGELPTRSASINSTISNSTTEGEETPKSQRSRHSVWGSTFRMLKWESREAERLALQRRTQREDQDQAGYREWLDNKDIR